MTHQTTLGATGPTILPFALGCMSMAGAYGASDDAESIATIQLALERGVTLLDTGDFYGMGTNELLIREALRGRRDRALLSVKYGAQRGPDGAFLGFDASPNATKTALTYSLVRLGVDHVDIYRPARLDPKVPIEDTIGALLELVKAGYVRHIGLSEVGADTIRRAAKVHPIVDLQIEYAIVTRNPEATIIPVLRELGIGMTAYGVLSRGLLTGSKTLGATDGRAHLPRFVGENGEKNAKLVAALAQLAKDKGVTPAQLAIAWVRKKGELSGVSIVPTLGARTRVQLTESLASLDVSLSAAEMTALEAALPADAIAGARYPVPMMAHLDSER